MCRQQLTPTHWIELWERGWQCNCYPDWLETKDHGLAINYRRIDWTFWILLTKESINFLSDKMQWNISKSLCCDWRYHQCTSIIMLLEFGYNIKQFELWNQLFQEMRNKSV